MSATNLRAWIQFLGFHGVETMPLIDQDALINGGLSIRQEVEESDPNW